MSRAAHAGSGDAPAGDADRAYFTVFAGGEIFGIPVENTQAIFRIATFTPVPLSSKDIVGLVNLRGKIVTAVSLRRRLRMPAEAAIKGALAIGIEHRGETFALIVDEVGDVLTLEPSSQIPIPTHCSPHRAILIKHLCRAGQLLLPVLDIEPLFTFPD